MVDIKSLLMSSAQLLAGWVGLALSTAALGLFKNFPVFSVVDDEAKHDVFRRTHRRVSRHDNAVGMWLVAEIVLLELLLLERVLLELVLLELILLECGWSPRSSCWNSSCWNSSCWNSSCWSSSCWSVVGRRGHLLLAAHRHCGNAVLLLPQTTAPHAHQIRNLVRPQFACVTKAV